MADEYDTNTVAVEVTDQPDNRQHFDGIIGRTDRCLSEIMLLAKNNWDHDQADTQTLKHHAEDLIQVGTAILKMISS